MKKVLLVDDSSTALMMGQMILQQSPNYHCLTANDGAEAVKKALEHHPDIVLMDVVMPVMNGFEACRQLRMREVTRNIPVVLVTTRSEPEYLETGYQCGCDDYITKPVDSKELLRVLESYLGE
ncbi:MAG: response regulator [Terriglobales bacterium]